jgi:flagellar hook protein FlgE
MSLFSTLNVGASGLGAASTGLGVAGDNIANIGTIGFKQSRASFADFLPQDVFGLSGTSQIGTGVATNTVSTLFGQGTLEESDSSLDMAISGNGFFMVRNGPAEYFTRAGEFYMDDAGYVTTASGLRLQGFPATDGDLSPVIGDLKVSTATLPGAATSSIVMDAVLSAETAPGADLAALDFHGTGAGTNTIAEAADAADFTTSITVYDSVGVAHDVTVCFERTDASNWSWRAISDATEVFDGTGTAYSTTDGSAFELASGTATFGTDGTLTGVTQTDTAGWTFFGASAQSIAFDFGIDAATGLPSDGSLSMTGSESAVSTLTQDGMTTGELSRLRVEDDGTIVGSYTNGEELTLGQVALATFKADNGLVRLGGTLFAASAYSGEPALGVAGTGGRGTLSGNALEKSNVDLEEQFVNMITMQRSYQASAKVVSAADESLQVLVNLI